MAVSSEKVRDSIRMYLFPAHIKGILGYMALWVCASISEIFWLGRSPTSPLAIWGNYSCLLESECLLWLLLGLVLDEGSVYRFGKKSANCNKYIIFVGYLEPPTQREQTWRGTRDLLGPFSFAC